MRRPGGAREMDRDRNDGGRGGDGEARGGGGEAPGGGSITLSGDMVWPLAVTLFLVTVVVVNMVFIYVAVSGADEVAPSYVTGER